MSLILAFVLLLLPNTFGLDNGVGQTPALAWSSWNYFGQDVNETVIKEIADAMVSTGLAKLGFVQINIDSGYLLRNRTPSGDMVVNKTKFPGGMQALSHYLATRDVPLGLGLYTDITNHTCGPDKGGPGAYGYYEHDALQFASWNISYLKVDMCSVDIGIDPASQLKHWGQLRDALNASGHHIYYSICPHSIVPHSGGPGGWWWTNAANGTRPNTYAPPIQWTAEQRKGLANSLLVEFTNLFDFWYKPHWLHARYCPGPKCNTSSPGGFLTNVDAMQEMTKPEYGGPGSWSDGDMLHVCNYGEGNPDAGSGGDDSGMTLIEYQSSLSIWAILASPIIISADLRSLPTRHPDCFKMLLESDEVLVISQDARGLPGRLVYQSTNATDKKALPTTTNIVEQIWARDLVGGKVGVALFNRGENEKMMTFAWNMFGDLGPRTARDAWLKKPIFNKRSPYFTNNITLSVQPHATRVIVLSPKN
eukprot:m.343847 g.343847  ORF g.343847 m.343847 type:complete len:477 (+) comp23440_c0_seq1:178-1608(+)